MPKATVINRWFNKQNHTNKKNSMTITVAQRKICKNVVFLKHPSK